MRKLGNNYSIKQRKIYKDKVLTMMNSLIIIYINEEKYALYCMICYSYKCYACAII